MIAYEPAGGGPPFPQRRSAATVPSTSARGAGLATRDRAADPAPRCSGRWVGAEPGGRRLGEGGRRSLVLDGPVAAVPIFLGAQSVVSLWTMMAFDSRRLRSRRENSGGDEPLSTALFGWL